MSVVEHFASRPDGSARPSIVTFAHGCERNAMRSGDARPGQRVGLLARDIGRRLEGFFIFEEGVASILAVSFELFSELTARTR